MTSSISTSNAGLPISKSPTDLISISPPLNSFSLVGPQNLQVTLTDACGSIVTHNLNILVTNSAPSFKVASFPEFVTPMNTIGKMSMTDFSDAEGHTVIIKLNEYSSTTGALLTTSPSFASITPGTYFEIQFYINSFALLGRHKI